MRGPVTEGTSRIGPFLAWPGVLDEFGVDADVFFREFGLRRTDFLDPEGVLPFRALGHMLRRAAEQTGCDHLGVLIGQRATLSSLGAIGFLAQASPTVGDALQALVQNFKLQDGAADLTLDAAGPSATLSYRIPLADIEEIEQIYMIACLVGLNFMRALCDERWRPRQVLLPFRRPHNCAPLTRALDAPVRFDAEHLAFVFSTSDMGRTVRTADPLLHRLMAERIDELRSALKTGLVDQVRSTLRTLAFLEGKTPAVVASRLGLPLRTLHRRLAKEGTTVRQLRDEVCCDAASQLLANTTKPAGEIAMLLGYSDASAFSRAFRRWRGVAPAQWRSEARRNR